MTCIYMYIYIKQFKSQILYDIQNLSIIKCRKEILENNLTNCYILNTSMRHILNNK